MNSIRAFIEIKLMNNEIIRYVNPTTQDSQGISGQYYSYTNEAGVDDYALQVGPGKAKGDFDNLIAQLGGTGMITWPEGGTELVRKNTSNSLAALSNVHRVIPKSSVVSMALVEQEVNDFQQLDIERNTKY